jgi:AbrB family looped-hinge helix DNA binding protein
MKTTIDGAGRVVIPKAVREEAGLSAGAEVEVEFRDGRIEIKPATIPMRLTGQGHAATIDAGGVEMPLLTSEDVRDVLERVRR